MKKAYLAFLFFVFLVACSDSSPSFVDGASNGSSKKMEGMILVHGGTVTLGSNDSRYCNRYILKYFLLYCTC